MFTGLVEATGRVASIEPGAHARRVVITTALPVEELLLGASVAVNGVCLTAVAREKGRFAADIGAETLAITTLADLRAGDLVHLERPLRAGDPLGGHLVAGHVDATGVVLARRPQGDCLELVFVAPPATATAFVAKGSVAIDGVSLTVNQVEPQPDSAVAFSVLLIPHTLAVTNLGQLVPGARVNLEADLIAKQVARLLDARLSAEKSSKTSGSFSLETLKKNGYTV